MAWWLSFSMLPIRQSISFYMRRQGRKKNLYCITFALFLFIFLFLLFLALLFVILMSFNLLMINTNNYVRCNSMNLAQNQLDIWYARYKGHFNCIIRIRMYLIFPFSFDPLHLCFIFRILLLLKVKCWIKLRDSFKKIYNQQRYLRSILKWGNMPYYSSWSWRLSCISNIKP